MDIQAPEAPEIQKQALQASEAQAQASPQASPQPQPQARSLKRKRTLSAVLRDIPPPESTIFEPLEVPLTPPKLCLPEGTDSTVPFEIFSLFWPDRMWARIAGNTNMYAIQKRTSVQSEKQICSWRDLCVPELKIFIGILIYMGLHKEYEEAQYWHQDLKKGPLHTCSLYMSRNRYQAIKRYFHISCSLGASVIDEDREPEMTETIQRVWWNKVEPLASIIRDACAKYYVPCSNVSIDEIMIRSYGRSEHTYKMPNKPISQGYKLFALADHGYIFWIVWSSRKQGICELIKHPELTPTGSMVLELSKRLPFRTERTYAVYLDNYFTSISLFEQLRDIGIGACGTTRISSAGKDYPELIKELRNDFSKNLPWNTVCAIPVRNNKVLALSWQDNNVVLALSTIHTVHKSTDFIERERRRPAKTSTNATVARAPFGDQPRKKLSIPRFIDDYNYNMGGVDIANQYRAAYETHKGVRRNWLCIFLALLDVTVVNSYRIAFLSSTQRNPELRPHKRPNHAQFRTDLYTHLFRSYDHPTLMLRRQNRKNKDIRMPTDGGIHTSISRPNRTQCVQCRIEADQKEEEAVSRRKFIPRSTRACAQCAVSLCIKGPCWERFHRMS